MRFTKQSVAALTLEPGRPYKISWDDALPGFGVRVNPTNKMWVVQYRAGGRSRRESIGRTDTIELEEARRIARASLAKAQLGGDPQAEKAEARRRAAITLKATLVPYLEHARRRLRPRTYEEVVRHLSRHWAPLHELPVHAIKRADVAARLGRIAAASGPFAANRSRAYLSAFFSWAIGEGIVDSSPVIGTNKAIAEVSRDRVLSEGELWAIWRACRADEYGRIVRLLMLTGQRREEVAGLSWKELDLTGKLWIIPKQRTKNGLEHEVPLSEHAVTVLKGVAKKDGRSHVFGTGKGGYSGWSKSKAALDARILAAAEGDGMSTGPWRLHDLRRTMATLMAERLGVQPHVIEAILNHISGHKAGVAGVYNRATYAAEKRDALYRWGEYLEALGGRLAQS